MPTLGPAGTASPGRTVRVRVAGPRDADRLGAFFRLAWREAGRGALGFTGATEATIERIASKQFLTSRLNDPNLRFVVAVTGGRVLGFASVRKMGGEGELSGIVVLESETGKGLGKKLLQAAFREAISLDIRKLVVKTEAMNTRAIAFYTKNGFMATGRTAERVEGTKVVLETLERELSAPATPAPSRAPLRKVDYRHSGKRAW